MVLTCEVIANNLNGVVNGSVSAVVLYDATCSERRRYKGHKWVKRWSREAAHANIMAFTIYNVAAILLHIGSAQIIKCDRIEVMCACVCRCTCKLYIMYVHREMYMNTITPNVHLLDTYQYSLAMKSRWQKQ